MDSSTNLSPEARELLSLQSDLYVAKKVFSSLPNLPNGRLKETLESRLSALIDHSPDCTRLLAEVDRLTDRKADLESDIEALEVDLASTREWKGEGQEALWRSHRNGLIKGFLLGAAVVGLTLWGLLQSINL